MADAEGTGGYRRRIDRVTAEDFLEGIETRTPAQLRAMRDDCREEEGRFSYIRRLLHGRMDMIRAEAARRAGGGTDLVSPAGDDAELVRRLRDVLADRSRGTTDPARALNSPVQDYPEVGHRGDESLILDSSLGKLPDLSDDELSQLLDRLEAEERRVSGVRRTVLDHLDRLQDELVARYRDGHADLSAVLAEAGGPSSGDADPAGDPGPTGDAEPTGDADPTRD